MISTSQAKEVFILLLLFMFTLSCGREEVTGPYEVVVQVELPDPLSDVNIGMPVTPDSTVHFTGDIHVQLGSSIDDAKDVQSIVIAIIPAYVSFDTTGSKIPITPDPDCQTAEADSVITITFYFAPQGTQDPFQDIYQATRFFIGSAQECYRAV